MSKQFYSILGNSQKLDGGAMFGNAPKALWQRWVDVDEQNRIDLVCRALLVKDGDKNILFETGIGAFFEPKFKDRYGVQEDEHVLLKSLKDAGLSHEDIDLLVLSHLHFDHAGGLLSQWQEGKQAELLFPNAEFIIGKEAWERAKNPHPRDRASFIPGLTDLIEQTGRLHLIEGESCDLLGEDYHFFVSNGHTPGMLLTEIETGQGPVVFAADLIPGVPWVHLPITMGYDRFPENLIEEKKVLLDRLIEEEGYLYFTHDPDTCLGQVTKDEKGRFTTKDNLKHLVKKMM
ncbi:MBL fold metallo-hydrolase [Kangiella aquimarina]|uniref:MBL fold metallo-hydrolase n=1 Tax=Kangiella aquimarina TaxID=261965 RepID=A0ABZ0X195_9GAMM|nr:MBL fold metallo-hydrolase [Kangiella aquimarina]WQG84353.1 MBL fold metallo-hydrolase [Kangiella aquimarina]